MTTKKSRPPLAADTYEAEYLRLASREGMEGLKWGVCTCKWSGCCQACWKGEGYDWHFVHDDDCERCQGRNWLPLPEAERLGALVRVAKAAVYISLDYLIDETGEGYWEAGLGGKAHGETDPTPEAALTRALLAATEAINDT